MKKTDEWGEFFPTSISPFGYNEIAAFEYYPLTKKESLTKGWKWKESDDVISDVTKTIPASKLPDSIEDIPDDILNWGIICEVSDRPFKIVPQELKFYRTNKLPIPHLHPDERYKMRLSLRNPRKLCDRTCNKCSTDIKTSYHPDRPEKVYCEKCYLKEVY